MARFDRNQFLLLATAIGAATATLAAKPHEVVASTPTPDDDVEPDEVSSCDGDTGQTGRAKYCPIAEGRRKGCLDWSMCTDLHLKAASELRLFDCLAASPTNACSSEGATTAFSRCALEVTSHACSDPGAAQACQRVARVCNGHQGPMMQSCAQWVAPLTSAGRTALVSCMVEGCDDYSFKGCLEYVR